jgi:hypothetical protein
MNPGKLILACRSQQRGDKAVNGMSNELDQFLSSLTYCYQKLKRLLDARRSNAGPSTYPISSLSRHSLIGSIKKVVGDWTSWSRMRVSSSLSTKRQVTDGSKREHIACILANRANCQHLYRLQVNHLGTALLGLLLLPKLASTPHTPDFSPRLTIVSSEVHYWVKRLEEAGQKHILNALNDPKKAKMLERYNVTKCQSIYFSSTDRC